MDKTIGMFGGKFLPLHNGHVNAILRASSRVDILFVVLSWCKSEPYSKELRMSWLGHSLREYPNIRLLEVEHEEGDYSQQWEPDSINIRKLIAKNLGLVSEQASLDKIFVGSDDHKGKFQEYYPEAEYIVLDLNRDDINMSGTQVRENPLQHFDYLPKIVKKHFVKRVLVTGIESVGKSTMVKMLRDRFNTSYVHEIGRDYCYYYNNELTSEHFDEIVMKHYLAQDDAAYDSNRVMFVDSDAVVTKYYKEVYGFNSDNNLIDNIINKQEFDLVIYLKGNTPWVSDGVRFLSDVNIRLEHDKMLLDRYKNLNYNIVVIDEDGDYGKRFDTAVETIKELMRVK